MAGRAIFFDRDNTLIVNDGYLGDPAGVVLMPRAAAAVAAAAGLGFVVVTVSNQSGVARGLFAESDVAAVDAEMDRLLLADDPAAVVSLHLFCPDHPRAKLPRYRRDSPDRKPAPGLLLKAAARLDLDLSQSWLIGDAPRDIQAAHTAGCRAILFTPPAVAASPDSAAGGVPAEAATADLVAAVEIIRAAGPRKPPAA